MVWVATIMTPMWDHDVSDQFLYGESEAVLLVYDVTNRKSFADLTLWLEVDCGAKLDGSTRLNTTNEAYRNKKYMNGPWPEVL